MTRTLRWWPVIAGSIALSSVLLAVGCSTTAPPERFHTLLPGDRAIGTAATVNPVHIDVAAVGVPPQVDHAQWVVRQADDSLLMLEQDRWAAPLRDELRSAIVDRLAARWSAIDVRSVAAAAPASWRLRVDVQRFESIPGREARLEATWSLSPSRPGTPVLVCRSSFSDTVAGADVAALAAAHRRVVVKLADEIGQRLAALHNGSTAGC